MKVLFVRSGNNGIDPISTQQGLSLKEAGAKIIFFDIIGKGALGYLRNIGRLRKVIKKNQPDIIHSHYSFSGFVALLTFSRVPIGISLMGSDVIGIGRVQKLLLKVLINLCEFTIVKSKELHAQLSISRKVYIIPNGVNLEIFHEIKSEEAKQHLGWTENKIHALFASNPERKEKNYPLAKAAIDYLINSGFQIEMHDLHDIKHSDMVYFYNGCDFLLLTSLYEGSPNVIKEAMACNCPIVATNVGDIKEIITNTKGCYVTTFEADNIVSSIKEVLHFSKPRTDGRLMIQHLDSKKIAKEIIQIYTKVLERVKQ